MPPNSSNCPSIISTGTPGGTDSLAAGHAAAIQHQAEATVGHLDGQRLGLRPAGRMSDEHQRGHRQFTVAGYPRQVVQHPRQIDFAEPALEEEDGQALVRACLADGRVFGKLGAP